MKQVIFISAYNTITVRITQQRPLCLSRVVSSEKSKHILENKLIKYNLSSGKPKKPGWGFLKVAAILNIL